MFRIFTHIIREEETQKYLIKKHSKIGVLFLFNLKNYQSMTLIPFAKTRISTFGFVIFAISSFDFPASSA